MTPAVSTESCTSFCLQTRRSRISPLRVPWNTRETMREWGQLQFALMDEPERYTETHPELKAELTHHRSLPTAACR